jgi:hypothetical protein
MSDLNNDLAQFARAIVRKDEPSSLINTRYVNYLLDTSIEVYRNNYRGNLHDALSGAYPVIKQLVGDDFFRFLALGFIEQNPSRSANLHHYGAELADFVTHFKPAQELVYLSDIAALEWACHVAYFEKDVAIFDFKKLAELPAEDHPNLVFDLHPATRIVRSNYPINAIWQAHQPNASTDSDINLNSGHCIALISRKADVVQVIELSPADAEWLQLIKEGSPLGIATFQTLQNYPDFDLQTTLLKLVIENVLIDFRQGE